MAKRKGFGWPVTLALAGVPILFSAVWLLGLEGLALTDDTPRNAITTALQQALEARPHLFVVVSNFITGVCCTAFGLVMGHTFHQWTGPKAHPRPIEEIMAEKDRDEQERRVRIARAIAEANER